eukprot:TRINITY_DN12446_c1_g1_i1.p1 TRINITY_DN12446_c1_g1~~TRINITY_DN12446_c1_g1_i1.p1  ORF type:complete len:563 (+),score=203.12 TRINITY_DN12446_c1_g1_i1:250-1938(+)
MSVTTMRRMWVQAGNRKAVAALWQQARLKGSDPLDLDDEEEIAEEAPHQEQAAAPEQETAGEVEEEERPQRPRSIYTFGSKLNGRTGTNASFIDMCLRPLNGQHPTKIDFFDNFEVKKVAGQYKHYLTLLEDGRVFAWGSNNYGQLGCGDSATFPQDRHAPVLVRTADGEPLQNIVDVAVGKYHSAAVDAEGRVYTWGFGGRSVRFGAGHLLGYPATKGTFLRFSPHAVPLAEFGPENGMEVESEANPFEEGKSLNAKAVKVACGAVHTVVLDTAGRAWTWGYGDWGRLGHGDNEDRTKPTPIVAFLDEKTGLPRTHLTDIAASESITSLTTKEGMLLVCGSDRSRQLGFGSEEQGLRTSRFEAINEPHHVNGLTQVGSVSFGSHAALALTTTGVPHYWGGQETRGPQVYQHFGQRSKLKIKQVSCGSGPLFDDHRAFVTTKGELFMNGANLFGQALADTRPRDASASAISVIKKYIASWRSTPLSSISLETQQPAFFKDKYVVDVACGHASAVVVAEDMDAAELEKRGAVLEEVLDEIRDEKDKKGGKAGEKKKDRTNFGK